MTQTAEKFHINGMHTFHTDTVYDTLRETERGFLENVTEPVLYKRMKLREHMKSKGDQSNMSKRIHLKTISKPNVIFTDSRKNSNVLGEEHHRVNNENAALLACFCFFFFF